MKNSYRPQEIKIAFCSVSTSLLLCSSLEMRAAPVEEEPALWYDQPAPPLTLPLLANGRFSPQPDLRGSRLTTEDASPFAWDQLYGKASRQAQTDYQTEASTLSGAHEFKGPAILTLQSGSGHTQRVGLVAASAGFKGTATVC